MLGSQLCCVRRRWHDRARHGPAPPSAPASTARGRGPRRSREPSRSSSRSTGHFDGVIHAAAYTAVDQAEWRSPGPRSASTRSRMRRPAHELRGAHASRSSSSARTSSSTARQRRRTARTTRRDRCSAYGRDEARRRARGASAPSEGGTRIVRTQWLYGPRGQPLPGTIREARARAQGARRWWTTRSARRPRRLELAPAPVDVLSRGGAAASTTPPARDQCVAGSTSRARDASSSRSSPRASLTPARQRVSRARRVRPRVQRARLLASSAELRGRSARAAGATASARPSSADEPAMSTNVLVTGGAGFIGSQLRPHARRGRARLGAS